MGSGKYSPTVRERREEARIASGRDAFAYDEELRTLPADQRKVHQLMNPYGVIREARDSAEHPDSKAIVVGLDDTGSMRKIPRFLQKKFVTLMNTIQSGGVVDPQILFCAVGDYTCDSAPLQVGQFESDNKMEEWLQNIYLEGGGGSGNEEGYLLLMYFLAYKTKLDCFEKRSKKGILFLIVDELSRKSLNRKAISEIIGDEVQADVPAKQIVEDLKKMYDVYVLFPASGSGYSDNQEHHTHWENLFPERVLLVEPEDMPEMIAAIVAKLEGNVGDAQIEDHLRQLGVNPAAVKTVRHVLSSIDSSLGIASGPLPGIED